jgi:hypothetical protein
MNKIVPAQVEHAEYIASRLRKADHRELTSASGLDPLTALLVCVASSTECYAWLCGDEVVGLFGVAPLARGVGCPWAAGTDAILRERDFMFSDVQPYIERFNQRYPLLENHVHIENTVHIRWLERCGFTICAPEPYGARGELFHPFFKEL